MADFGLNTSMHVKKPAAVESSKHRTSVLREIEIDRVVEIISKSQVVMFHSNLTTFAIDMQ